MSFRYYTRQIATRLGLMGFVKNLSTGQVEVWAQGAPAALEEFSAWLLKGPSGARVEKVDEEPRDLRPGLRSFEVHF